MKLQEKVALITGASRGIGRATALSLAAEGAAIAVNYRSGEQQAREVVEEIIRQGGQAISIGADVADYQQVAEMVEHVIGAFGALHILVNNAGTARDGLIYHLQPDDWLNVMRVNFGGVFNCTKAVLDHFMSRGDGVIVNVSSGMAEKGWTGESNYAASKGAINAFTRCCACELARFGIRVNAVLPGFSPTDLISEVIAKDGGRHILKQIPLRAFARPEEVAQVIRFVASSDASYMTGATINIVGGFSSVLCVRTSE